MKSSMNFEKGHAGTLHVLADNRVPGLNNFWYATHAPYDPLKDDTLLLNCNFKDPLILPAATLIEKFTPGELLVFESAVFNPVPRVRLADKGVYELEKPIGSVSVETRVESTNVSFRDVDGNQLALDGLPEDGMMVGVSGLVFAVQDKLTRFRGAGRDFSQPVAPGHENQDFATYVAERRAQHPAV